MFERVTDRARRVVVLAREEARMLNHDHIGTEHLLLGLITEGRGVAAKALESLGISPEAVRSQVEETMGRGVSPATGPVRLTPRAKHVLVLSLREAHELGDRDIGTEHILLGLIREGEGGAAQVLRNLEVHDDSVRRQVIHFLRSSDDEEKTRSSADDSRPDPRETLRQAVGRARGARELAADVARAVGGESMTEEDLLYGLAMNEDHLDELARLVLEIEERSSVRRMVQEARKARKLAERLAAASGDPSATSWEILFGLQVSLARLLKLEMFAGEVDRAWQREGPEEHEPNEEGEES